MSKLLSDPEIMKLVIYGLAGVCGVLMLAVLFLAIKRNIYYVDENGDEIIPVSKKEMKQRRQTPKKEETPAEPEPVPVQTAEPVKAEEKEEEEEKIQETMVVPSPVYAESAPEEPAAVPEFVREVPVDVEAPAVTGVRIRVTVAGRDAEYAVDHLPCLIGRASGTCDLTISEPAISRRHARLAMEDGRIVIEDVSEHNGTFVNGRKLPSLGSAEIHEGDKISLGRAEITVQQFLYEE